MLVLATLELNRLRESFFEADMLGLPAFAGLLVLGIAVAAYRTYSSQENAHG
jgi:hypothetical protein